MMRGERLRPTAFPEPDELYRLLDEGQGRVDLFGPLSAWVAEHPEPDFHPPADV
jgi:hypothetical protein